MKTDNTLSLEGIVHFIYAANKSQMSTRIHIFDCLESTNITAKEMSLSGAEHGTVILADSQTAGKGCRGKSFFSPQNHGLYMSFILDAERLPLNTPTLVTVFAAVAVCEAIEAITDKTPKVKWVNDIFQDGKKICGILTESVIGAQSHNIRNIVLGIGINFNTPKSDFPEELQEIAGSLFEAQSPSVTRNHLAAEIINRVVYPYSQYNEKELLDKYNQRLFSL